MEQIDEEKTIQYMESFPVLFTWANKKITLLILAKQTTL